MARGNTLVEQIFYVLPATERRDCGRCDCKHPLCTQEWDTRSIGLDGRTWDVHYPELRVGDELDIIGS